MKILVAINENFQEMILGKNTTLAYILAVVDLNFEVLVYNISDDTKFCKKAIYLNKNNARILVEQYKLANQKIVDGLLGQQNQGFRDILVGEVNNNFLEKEFSFDEIDFVIQRLEPMKWPFPPAGDVEIEDFLSRFKQNFADKFIFNFPVNVFGDKELPLVFSQEQEDLATPTAISFYGDLEMTKKLQKIAKKYSEIFANKAQKIVLKPDNSAQALGVFAVEIDEKEGLNLEQIKQKTVAELLNIQRYQINVGKHWQDVESIINILCFVQSIKAQKKSDSHQISQISASEIAQNIHSLYGKKILIQPFLEGVAQGDIRINLAKMSDGNFVVVGAVFRKSISYDEQHFTTCLTAGASMAQAVERYLSQDELKNLTQKIQFILQKLNQDPQIKAKYRQILEIGCDFLLVGNKKDVYFGEANHHCQALIPFSESIEKAQKTKFYDQIDGLRVDYDGGLAIIKAIILQQIKLQAQN